jgi:biopolymer transport protein ExbB
MLQDPSVPSDPNAGAAPVADPSAIPTDAAAIPVDPSAIPVDPSATAATAGVDPSLGVSTEALAGTKADNAAAMSQMGFAHMVQNFDFVGWIVFVTLIVMSAVSVYYIVINALRNSMIRSRASRVIKAFWNSSGLQASIDAMQKEPRGEPFSKIAIDCVNAVAHHQRSEGSSLVEALNRSEFIDRALRQAVTRESSRLETGLTWLATTGSTAPFVGLLGTVWGIYHALLRIASSGQASMDAVAGPVGEALIMTAFGLFVAIPAVIGFNFFVRGNKKILSEFDEFAHDLHDYFATGARIEGGGPAAARPAAKK